MAATAPTGVVITAPMEEGFERILTAEALAFVAELERGFGPTRRDLLAARAERRARIAAGEEQLDFLAETAGVREGDWMVEPAPPDLRERRVEITGPTQRKLLINAFNSGASGFMADFEDSNAPTWANMVEGHVNLIEAIEGTIEHDSAEGKHYELNDDVATLLVRPRGWHLPEKHLLVDGEPASGALFDFGLFVFHNACRLVEAGSGPYFYLPKIESHHEARLWNEVFVHAEKRLGIPHGTIKATVLIETIPAAFEMDEILYELREHSAGLNAGRWDYIFSMIKTFRDRPEFLLPDRNDVKMTVPFMRAYTELLVKTCHRRGAHAMGGMAALIPSRKDAEANEQALAGVKADKAREAQAGFDGTWVAHPDLVETAMAEFDAVLGDRPNQLEVQRDDVSVTAAELLDAQSTPGAITEAGLRNDVSVGIQYLSNWFTGNGAAAINNLMEDAATAEISRSQVWQWINQGAELDTGERVTVELVRRMEDEELAKVREGVGDELFFQSYPEESKAMFDRVATSEEFEEFLTLPAYGLID